MAAVNDITSRDENLQNYLAQTTLKSDMLANRIPHPNSIYDATNDEHIHHMGNIESVPLHLTQMGNQQQPTTSAMSHQYHSNSMKVNGGGENEFVDINDMNFMEHRREIDHENLLVRRSQRKIKKDEECECLCLACDGSGSLNSKNSFVSVVISDKQVPYRSLCSLPTAYLYINGNGDSDGKHYLIESFSILAS